MASWLSVVAHSDLQGETKERETWRGWGQGFWALLKVGECSWGKEVVQISLPDLFSLFSLVPYCMALLFMEAPVGTRVGPGERGQEANLKPAWIQAYVLGQGSRINTEPNNVCLPVLCEFFRDPSGEGVVARVRDWGWGEGEGKEGMGIQELRWKACVSLHKNNT